VALTILFSILHYSFVLLILFLTLAFVTGAPFVPSTQKASLAMIALAKIKSGDVVYDLGSGDGRLLFLAAKKGARAIGYEINPFLVFYTWVKIQFSPERKLVEVHWRNFWSCDLSKATIVFVYLLPWRMKELEQKLIKSVKPSARIVSNSFIFPSFPLIDKNVEYHIYVSHIV
jgi:hypothetical protein